MAAVLEAVVVLLVQLLREPLRRKELVSKFQTVVWEGLDPSLPAAVREVLRELAYDLDFFEASPTTRAEDGSYYGHRRLEEEVRAALVRLRDAGVEVGGDL